MRGRPIPLTRKEFELLAILAGEPGRVFGRDGARSAPVWGRDGFVEPGMRRAPGPPAGEVPLRKAAGARRRDRPGGRLPVPGAGEGVCVTRA